ncbi:hypothetical protein DFS34DRAFT_80264 [Phlyctochytrium arcticum]|nr:hypothetical protein DFS34DRAFT_80264 [Phlyctochytrium arcticum]
MSYAANLQSIFRTLSGALLVPAHQQEGEQQPLDNPHHHLLISQPRGSNETGLLLSTMPYSTSSRMSQASLANVTISPRRSIDSTDMDEFMSYQRSASGLSQSQLQHIPSSQHTSQQHLQPPPHVIQAHQQHPPSHQHSHHHHHHHHHHHAPNSPHPAHQQPEQDGEWDEEEEGDESDDMEDDDEEMDEDVGSGELQNDGGNAQQSGEDKEKEAKMQQSQQEMRKRIMVIQQDQAIPAADKAKKIQVSFRDLVGACQ